METLLIFARSMLGFGNAEVKGLGIPKRRSGTQRLADEELRVRSRVIMLITLAMLMAFALSLFGTVILAVLGRNIPDVLPQILFATLGYFGGAFASFMRFGPATG